MSRRRLIVVATLGLAGWLLFTPVGQVASQGVQQVFVTNFPRVQTVEGEVAIRGPVTLARLVAFSGITVPPVKPTETTRLVEAGTLTTDGFPQVMLSLHGEVKGEVVKSGSVGAMLIPLQPSIQEAFNEQGLVHFALQTTAAGVSSATPYFASDQPQYRIGFQAYRVLLFNTTDKTVEVNLFAYLTN